MGFKKFNFFNKTVHKQFAFLEKCCFSSFHTCYIITVLLCLESQDAEEFLFILNGGLLLADQKLIFENAWNVVLDRIRIYYLVQVKVA